MMLNSPYRSVLRNQGILADKKEILIESYNIKFEKLKLSTHLFFYIGLIHVHQVREISFQNDRSILQTVGGYTSIYN